MQATQRRLKTGAVVEPPVPHAPAGKWVAENGTVRQVKPGEKGKAYDLAEADAYKNAQSYTIIPEGLGTLVHELLEPLRKIGM